MSEAGATLRKLREAGLYRRMRMIESAQGAHVSMDGRRVMLLCSNDYLGLANHPAVRRAATGAISKWGTGAGASRLVSGNMSPHRRLEERIAAFKGTEAAVLFGSGYLANNGVIPALAGRGETVFSDELNHASIVDGCRLARAETFVYRHRDVEHLAWGLRRARRPALIVSDGVFSMDGDVAPLSDLVELKYDYGCRLMIDDAHGTATVGPEGRGAVAAAGLTGEVDVITGTFGKALGSYGAFACTGRETAELLVNTARPLIFSTGLPPSVAAAAEASLAVVCGHPERVRALRENAKTLRRALADEGFEVRSKTHILPLIIGGADDAVALCERLLERGLFAQAIRPPTVPEGTSRLRLTVMATHRARELEAAARAIGAAARSLGVIGAGAGREDEPSGRLVHRHPPKRRESEFVAWDAEDAMPLEQVAPMPAALAEFVEPRRERVRTRSEKPIELAPRVPRGAAAPDPDGDEPLVPRLRPRRAA